MPELPDIVILARSMDQALAGRVISESGVFQPKCLNLPAAEFQQAVAGRVIVSCRQRGKWVLCALDNQDILAFNLGMGGEVLLHGAQETPNTQRERVVLRLDDGRQLWAHFWWFGNVHLVRGGDLSAHQQLGRLGAEPLADDFTVQRLAGLLRGRRGGIKSYLLDQSFIAGIGNVYVQDTLWRARLHPLRAASTLHDADTERLYSGIQETLREGIRWSGGPGEQDVWGHRGTYAEHLQVGYRTGKPCPACGAPITELRVGATMSYICPNCQV